MQGLPPGRYHYKFIMDGKWVVDLSAATEDDEHGNKNNVVEQMYAEEGDQQGGLARPSAWQGLFGGRNPSSSDVLPVVRLEASRIALDMKMRPMK